MQLGFSSLIFNPIFLFTLSNSDSVSFKVGIILVAKTIPYAYAKICLDL
jgi:hypothetical protein